MSPSLPERPRIRPVEAYPIVAEGEQMIVMQDPAGLAEGPIMVSPAGFFLCTCFDGRQSLYQVQNTFRARFGQSIPLEQIEQVVHQLESAYYLEGERFDSYYRSLVEDYRRSPVRVSGEAAGYGAGEDGLPAYFDQMLNGTVVPGPKEATQRLVGLIAPHLDYPRGAPCYAPAYRTLAAAGPARRYILLGTNHFGQGTSVTATGKSFQTPLGLTDTDTDFLDAIQQRCGHDLCRHEFDHLREHSIELQVILLQHLFGAENFQIVPLLCHDPCGPNGTGPYDGEGVDLRDLSRVLGELVAETEEPTVIIAGADLSHVGMRFGDERELDDPFLREIEAQDRSVLAHLIANEPDGFVRSLAQCCNPTRICSAGSMFTLRSALPAARAELLQYHQAADRESGTGVTCCAAAFWQS